MAEQIIQRGDEKTSLEVIELLQKYFPNAINETIGQNENLLATLFATFYKESAGLFATIQSGFFADSTEPGKQDPSKVRFDNRIGKAEPSFGLAQINADVHLSSILDKIGIDKNDTNIQKAISNRNFYDLDEGTQRAVATWLSDPDNNLTMAKEIYDMQGINAWTAYKNFKNTTEYEIQYNAGLTIPNYTPQTQTPPPTNNQNQNNQNQNNSKQEEAYQRYLKNPMSLLTAADVQVGGVLGALTPDKPLVRKAYNKLVRARAALGYDEKTVFADLINTWLDMTPSEEWDNLSKFIVNTPFLIENSGKYEQFQDVNNIISNAIIDYDWAEAQAYYGREEGKEESGRAAARWVGIAKNWVEKMGREVTLIANNIVDNIKQTFDTSETAGFFSEFLDELGVMDVSTEEVISPEIAEFIEGSDIVDQSILNAVQQAVNATATQTPELETVYWARQGDSWITTTETDKPADADWAWKLKEFEYVDKAEFEVSKYPDYASLSADFPRLLALSEEAKPKDTTTTPTVTQEISRDWNTDGSNIIELGGKRYALFVKDDSFRSAGSEDEFNDLLDEGYRPIGNENPIWTDFKTADNISDDDINVLVEDTVDYETIAMYDADKRDGSAPSQVTTATADSAATVDATAEEVVVEDEAQLVTETLNDFNNIPKNAVTIQAGEKLFLAYQVPGVGVVYNEPPINMIYEVLGNDLIEAGLLTEGATPNVNISLPSVQGLNQYGIVVGGTDELTDDVEHPFIRFVENFEAGKRINPWLADTSINPNTGVTYQQEAIEFLAEQALEQFTPEQTQTRYESSDWYRKSTAQQKTWLTTVLTQPVQAEQDIQDKQIEVKAAMEANGIASPPDALVNWVADKAVTGMWTQTYTDQQVALLADPYKPGTRDTGMVNFIEGVGVGTLDRLSVGEKTVTDLYRRYLGPSLGNASDDEIAEKAGQLRSDPDAEQQLKSYLEQQRLAMFGNYTNPTLTYNDIVQPYKNLVNQVWGQEVDETQDWFIKMVQDNDIEKAYTTLREKGIDQGIERVQDQALNDLQSSIGQGQIAPQLGANS